MIVKPSIGFLTRDNDAQFTLDCDNIMTCMADNPLFVAPDPAIGDIVVALNQFKNDVAASVNGGKDRINAKNNSRLAVANFIRLLALYVARTCNGNLNTLLSSGFPICKPERQLVGVLPAPVTVTLTLGVRSGDLKAGTPRMAGAATYNWILATAANPGVAVQTAHTTAARNTFSGVTPGVLYQVTASVTGSSGPSDWSDPASQMAV